MATTTLSREQLTAYARQAGFTGDALATIVAIALAESRGNPFAHNAKAPDNSYGLTQINMIDKLGPARLQQFGLTSYEQLFDPLTNFRAAYAVSGGGANFRPWTTFTSGDFRQYLTGGLPDDWIPGVPPGLPIPNPFDNPATDFIGDQLADAFGAAVGPFTKGLQRLSLIGLALTGGVALVVAGGWRNVRVSS